jgi:hypothetical protein
MGIATVNSKTPGFFAGGASPASAVQLDAPAWPVYDGILDALYRFGAGQDTRNKALFASAFSEHAQLDFVQPAALLGVTLPIMQGRDNIADAIMGTLEPLATTHTVTNPRISVQGNTANLWALVEAQHVLRAAPERQLLLKNIYNVALTRSADTWRITLMKIDMVWKQGDRSVLFPD